MHTHDHDLTTTPAPRIARHRGEATHREGAGTAVEGSAVGPLSVLGTAGVLRLQRLAGNEAVSELVEQERSPVLDVVGRGGGSPMSGGLRSEMEQRLGADFSDVRFHTDGQAHESARAVGARAYTVGNDVVFQRDAFDPDSHDGRTTIAHELTHVVQQRSGPVAGTDTGTGVRVSDPGDAYERAAVANAEAAMSAPVPVPVEHTGHSHAEPAAQRELDEAAVQREPDEALQRESEESELEAEEVEEEPEAEIG